MERKSRDIQESFADLEASQDNISVGSARKQSSVANSTNNLQSNSSLGSESIQSSSSYLNSDASRYNAKAEETDVESKLVAKLKAEITDLKSQLSKNSKKLQTAILKDNEKTDQYTSRIQQLEQELDLKNHELQICRHDLDILGEKLTDAIEQRAELQHAKEQVSEELEELTRRLFEEANNMVASERRQNAENITKGALVAKQLAETQRQLQLEQAQLKDLRIRYAEIEQTYEELLIKINNQENSKASQLQVQTEIDDQTLHIQDIIDQKIFAQFKELVEAGTKLKFHKIHNYLFMRNALEDEVIPCLRFGGNPLTSTKKFIDAIVANSCFIEEMQENDIAKLLKRDEQIKLQQELEQQTTPTQSLFHKTVLEKIANALTYTEELPVNGCSTCGKDEPYRYRFKISELSQEVWCPICISCRDRLTSVVDFYQFIRNLRQGLYSTRPIEDLYFETMCLKRNMFYTRIGAIKAIRNPRYFTSVLPVRMNSSILFSHPPELKHQTSQSSIGDSVADISGSLGAFKVKQ